MAIAKEIIGGIVAGVAGIGAGVSAQAEDVNFRMGHIYPATHYIQTQLLDVFSKAVSERSGNSITIQNYPAAQLGKDVPGLVRSNLLDIGVFATGIYPDLFPLASVGELPQGAASACEGSEKMDVLALPGGILDELEWKPQGLRVLSSHMLAPYSLFVGGDGVKTLADVQGKKIWASGPAADMAIRTMGGVPIRIPSTEIYDSATRGTIDGIVLPYTSMTQYNLLPVLKHSLSGVTLGSGVFYVTIAQDDWDALTPEQQVILEEEAQKAQRSFCEYVDGKERDDSAKAAAIEGFVVNKLEVDELKAFDDLLRGIGDSWAKTFDEAGREGTKVLEAFRAAQAE